MLTALLGGGHLARASALVFGGMTDCQTGPDGVTVEDVLRERARTLGLPCVMGAPFGHGPRNDPFILGAEVEVVAEPSSGRVGFAEP
jgi:muramoyltetrapeptide carboxypeptidase